MLTLSKPQAHSYDSGDEVMGYGYLIEVAIAAAGGYAYLNSKGAWQRSDIVDYKFKDGVLMQIKTTQREICESDFWATMCNVDAERVLGSTTEDFT